MKPKLCKCEPQKFFSLQMMNGSEAKPGTETTNKSINDINIDASVDNNHQEIDSNANHSTPAKNASIMNETNNDKHDQINGTPLSKRQSSFSQTKSPSNHIQTDQTPNPSQPTIVKHTKQKIIT